MATYDVIVVGARCAGAPTAMLFARAGYRVLLLERARLPRDTLSTLYIHQPGVALLHQWGVLDRVVATGCPAITSVLHRVGEVRLEGCSAPVNGIRAAYAPRRHLLDGVLAEAAVAAGVELRDQCAVRGVLVEDGRVVGVRFGGSAGGDTARAALVVGADGMRSTIARAVEAPVTAEHPRRTCVYYTFWSGLQAGFEMHGARGGWAGCAPTNDGLTLVACYFPQREFADVRSRAQESYTDGIRRVAPELYDRLHRGTQEDRLRGTGAQFNFFRRAFGPGWVLVGDAGHHKDSITADGITDAFRQAQLLVDHVGGELQDRAGLEAGLRRFAEERDRLLTRRYHNTLAVARLRPDSRIKALAAVAADPPLVERFFTSMSGADLEDTTLVRD